MPQTPESSAPQHSSQDHDSSHGRDSKRRSLEAAAEQAYQQSLLALINAIGVKGERTNVEDVHGAQSSTQEQHLRSSDQPPKDQSPL